MAWDTGGLIADLNDALPVSVALAPNARSDGIALIVHDGAPQLVTLRLTLEGPTLWIGVDELGVGSTAANRVRPRRCSW